MRRRALALYVVAHVGKSLLWTAGDLLTIYALVSLYRMDAAIAGWLFLAGLAVNAFADVAIGAWLDRHPAWTPWLASGALVVAAVAFPPTMLLAPLGPGAVMTAMLAFRVAYAGYDVPHNALLSRLADRPGMAARLSRGRTLGTGCAAALVGAGLHHMPGPAGLPVLLCSLAAAAALLGGALIPLLVRMPGSRSDAVVPLRAAGVGLPCTFLVGSLIGIVALGALARTMLHLPADPAHPDAGTTLVLLTIGRTAAALLPTGVPDGRVGSMLLAIAWFAAAAVVAVLVPRGDVVALVGLGLAMGVTNLIGWALLPALARGARSYGLYTMTGKLALGGSGLAMGAWLGDDAVFGIAAFGRIVTVATLACILAALVVWPWRRLTLSVAHSLKAP